MARFAFLPDDTPFGLAHRGGDEVATENTVAAFEHAHSLGYTHVETDVHLTADGVLVAVHDADLERVAGTPGSIADRSWSELRKIDLGAGERIPTMASLFEMFPDTNFNIEPKSNASLEPLINLIRDQRVLDRVCIGSFSDSKVMRAKAALGPELCTSPGPRHMTALWAASKAGRALSSLRSSGFVSRIADQHGCLQIPRTFGGLRVLDTHLVELAHDLGLQVHVWTINDADEMHDLLDAGVDAVMTDKLTVLRNVLESRGEW